MKRTLIGHITVDSGQFVIIDPAYLSRWQDNEFQDVRQFQETHGDNILQYGVDFENFQSPIESQGGKCMNELLDADEYEKLDYVPPGGYGLDFNSAAHRTINDKGGIIGGCAVASRTAWGDGRFPVYHVRDDAGNLLRVEISFEEE